MIGAARALAGHLVRGGRRIVGVVDTVEERLWEVFRLSAHRPPTSGEMTAMLRRNKQPGFREYCLICWANRGQRPSFLPARSDALIERLGRDHAAAMDDAKAVAEQALRGIHDVLGSGPVDCRRGRRGGGHRLDWRLDPTTGERYRRGFSHWRWDPYRMRRGNADMKGPWELTRLQHFAPLGLAWWATGDPRFARLYRDTVSDFLRRNPPGIGVQWSCTMDVALRAVGMLVGLSFFRASPALSVRWWDRFLKGMVDHARFIVANLEYGTVDHRLIASNHQVANLLGLYWIALCFPALDAGSVWRGIAEDGLEREIRRQMLADGGNVESSVPYHVLTLEMFLSAYALSLHHGVALSPGYRERLVAAFDWLRCVRQPGGRLPQVGDADSGRAHQLGDYGRRRYESADHLLAAAAAVLQCPALADDVPRSCLMEAMLWEVSAGEPATPKPLEPASLLADSGLAVLRAGPSYLLMSNGPVGTFGVGNHKHNDQLAIEWVVGRVPLLVDGGSYIYSADPAARNRFRSVTTHNTVAVDGEEQNHVQPEWLFRMFQTGDCGFSACTQEAETIVLEGWHEAYTRLDPPVRHRRRVTLSRQDGTVRIDDRLENGAHHKLCWHFLVHPDIAVAIDGRSVWLSREGAALGELRLGDPGPEWRCEPGWYSPCYGRRQPTAALLIEPAAGTLDRLCIDLHPGPDAGDRPATGA